MVRKALPSTKLQASNRRAFSSFYDTYAPGLWGCILLTKLPNPQAETILINTPASAWKQLESLVLLKDNRLSQLLRLAYQEGLPIEEFPVILIDGLRVLIRKASFEKTILMSRL